VAAWYHDAYITGSRFLTPFEALFVCMSCEDELTSHQGNPIAVLNKGKR